MRSAVFVVEQQCPYQDLDQLDQEAIHLYAKNEQGIQAYLRVIKPGAYFPETSIGRVLVLPRRQGLGTQLVKKGLDVAWQYFDCQKVRIEAQVYVMQLYEKVGFKPVSEPFLEDGIAHIEMIYVKGDYRE